MIPDIRFYDFEFNLLHIAYDCISSIWSLKYNDIGTFEAHFPLNSDTVNAIFDNKYVVAVQGDNQAIITSRQAGTEYVLFGRSINWLLSKRVTPLFDKSGNVSDLCAQFVSDALSSVGNVVINKNTSFSDIVNFTKDTYSLTSDVVRECLDLDGGGHNMVFDVKNKKWIFNVINGTSLPYIVSENNRTAYDLSYSTDMLDYANKGWYEKSQEEGESVWTLIDSDTSKTGIYAFYSVLSGQNEDEAKNDIKSKSIKTESSLTVRELKYGTDYNLGDIITVEFVIGKYKKRSNKKAVGIDIVYENGNSSEKPTFEEV